LSKNYNVYKLDKGEKVFARQI
jgi:hypothetical protein